MTDAAERKMRFLYALRSKGVTDARVLSAMEAVDRGLFVRGIFAERAYEDTPLPIACGQTISQPSVVALMTQALEVSPRDKVLEVGTGSGYQAAILSRLVREVVTLERFRTLADAARRRLERLGYSNIRVLHGDGMQPPAGRFDRIIVTAAAAELPPALIAALAPGGILVAPVGPEEGPQHLIRLTRQRETNETETLIPVRFVPLLPGQAQEL